MQLNSEAPHFWNLPRDTFCSNQPIILAHWGWDGTNKTLQTIFWTSFLQWKCFKFRSRFHWNLFVGNQTISASDNGLLLGRRQAIIWNNAGILLIQPPATNPSIILIATETFSFKKMYLKMSSGKCRSFCLGLNMLQKYIKSVSIFCRNRRNWVQKLNLTSHIYIYMLFVHNFYKGDIHFHVQGLNELSETTMIVRPLIRRQWANHLLGLGYMYTLDNHIGL